MAALRTAAIALALALLGACATTAHDDLATAADTLASKAHAFAERTENAPGQSPGADYTYARDVHALANQAEDFRRMASSGADSADLQAAWNELSQTYLTVNAEVDRSDNQWTQESWRSVNAAYLNLENHMKSYS
jgi:outer membrane murein-binding lipoprotein Lpp